MTKFANMDHPINTFITQHLGITVDEFSSFTGFPQSTVASWSARNRRVETLPINFYDAIAVISKQSIDRVYKDLIKLQDEYDRYIHESMQRAKEEPSVYMKTAQESIEIRNQYERSSMKEYLIKPSKDMNKGLKEGDKLKFIEAVFEIYSNIGRPVPKWIVKEIKSNDDFSEIGYSFYNNLIV